MKKNDRLTAHNIFRAFWNSDDKLEFWSKELWILSGSNLRKSWEAKGLLTITPLIELAIKENVVRKAADLTYSTIMSIVPILAIIFAVARGFGMEDMMWAQIERLMGDGEILDKVLMSVSKSVEMTKANSGWIFGVALLVLLYTANNAMCKLEDIFNEIWDVEGEKGWFERLPPNMFFLLVLPIAILMVGAITGQLETVMLTYVGFADWMIRCAVACVVFIAVYKVLPETRVLWRGTIISGIIAGVAFTVWHFVYLEFQNTLFNYNKVYGSFAAIPFFLIWTLISWIICLIGAKLNMILQMSVLSKGWTVYDQEKVQQMSVRDKLQIIITVAAKAVCAFNGGHKINLHRLVAETGLSDTYVSYALGVLCRIKFLHIEKRANYTDVYFPSVPVDNFSVGQLIIRFFSYGADEALTDNSDVAPYLNDLLSMVELKGDMLLSDLGSRK